MISGDSLQEQARAFSALADAAARFFAEPSQAQAGIVREHLGTCRTKAGAVRKGGGRDGREDMMVVSRHLSEAAVQAAKAVEECLLFKVSAGKPLSATLESLRDAAKDLDRSVRSLGRGGRERCADSVISAKRNAQQASRLADAGANEALQIPNTVESIKFKETFARLSRAADEVHQAADRLGEMAAVADD
ncbi:MAG: hypothetical protein HZB91_05100 [Elusimicrobia bacterium]|nr:hypothetical protein [Elusimicrobiota bacterium]